MGQEYTDRGELREALMKHWDLGAAALKRGAFLKYVQLLSNKDFENYFQWIAFEEMCQELTRQMWDEKFHEDVVFAKFLRYLDPDYMQVPDIPKDTMEVASISKEEFERRIEEIPPIVEIYSEQSGEFNNRVYDEKAYELYMTIQAEHGKMDAAYLDKYLKSGW